MTVSQTPLAPFLKCRPRCRSRLTAVPSRNQQALTAALAHCEPRMQLSVARHSVRLVVSPHSFLVSVASSSALALLEARITTVGRDTRRRHVPLADVALDDRRLGGRTEAALRCRCCSSRS